MDTESWVIYLSSYAFGDRTEMIYHSFLSKETCKDKLTTPLLSVSSVNQCSKRKPSSTWILTNPAELFHHLFSSGLLAQLPNCQSGTINASALLSGIAITPENSSVIFSQSTL